MDLGQIFTKDIVAEYMVSLFTLKENAKVLDPCFGDGAFLRALKKQGRYSVYGYEIDETLYDVSRTDFDGFFLKNTDFLQEPQARKYDGVIMNPPYIRHEKINEMSAIGVSKDILWKNPLYQELPSTANLYMYFILKAISLLKKNGEMIVIFPGSWEQAKSGSRFKAALYRECSVEKQIHIFGNVFEQTPLVDVVILKLCKDKKARRAEPEDVKLVENELIWNGKKDNRLTFEFNVPFSAIGTIRRGLTTGFNQFFINPQIAYGAGHIKEIISSPKQIKGYTTEKAETDQLLVIDRDALRKSGIKQYLSTWKRKILEKNEPQTLAKKIRDGKVWYELKLFDCRGIIFSYFVRNDMKFIFHESEHIIRDNFYIIFPIIDKWLCFSLLNNYYTYYQLECIGKKYGAGLLKIQRYDVENLMFADVKRISNTDERLLKEKAKILAETGNKKLIEEMTQIISKYAAIPFEEILKKYEAITRDRLEEL